MSTKLFDCSKKEAKRIFNITKGPNKGLLFNACCYAYSDRVHVAVNFNVSLKSALDSERLVCIQDVKILSIEHEDESGERFYINGTCVADLITRGENMKNYRFRAFYNTEKQNGVIKFEEQ